MKKTEEVTITRTVVLCDLCGGNASGTCVACVRDLCFEHSTVVEVDPWTLEHNGDYWQRFCADCLEAIPPTAAALHKIINSKRAELAEAESAWYKERREWGKSRM